MTLVEMTVDMFPHKPFDIKTTFMKMFGDGQAYDYITDVTGLYYADVIGHVT